MADAGVDTWEEVRRLRLEFADQIIRLRPDLWDLPSWCAGWRVRDVLGHLVTMGETSRRAMVGEIIRSGFRPDRAVDRLARAAGGQPVPELAGRLREVAEEGFRLPGVPPEMALGDVIIHSADAFRPAGIVPNPPMEDVVAVLDMYETWGRRVFHRVPHERVSLVATDGEWRHGTGPEVRGTAMDLLLLVANRRQVVDHLAGEGVASLVF